MILQEWLQNSTNDAMYMPYDGECVLNDEQGNHYVTIKEQGDQVVFIYSLSIENTHKDIYRDALLLNANPAYVGQANVAMTEDGETLALSVYGTPKTAEQVEELWEQAQNFREVTIECLEAEW